MQRQFPADLLAGVGIPTKDPDCCQGSTEMHLLRRLLLLRVVNADWKRTTQTYRDTIAVSHAFAVEVVEEPPTASVTDEVVPLNAIDLFVSGFSADAHRRELSVIPLHLTRE